MATKTVLATASPFNLNLSTTQEALSPAPKTAIQHTLATQSSSSPCSSARAISSPPATPQHRQASQASRTSQTPSQPPPTISEAQPCSPVSTSALSQPPIASSASPQTQPCPPSSALAPTQTPIANTTSPQTQSCSRKPLTAPHSAARIIFENVAICATIILGIVAVYYGAITLNYARWTKHNDFRDGCINDRDHDLQLSAECVSELMLPRVSAVKRQLGAVHDAYVDNALYWAVAIFTPVLTCVAYFVRMRMFARNEPRPVISLARIDYSGRGQGTFDKSSTTEERNGLSKLSHIRYHQVYNHVQHEQALKDASSSDAEPEEDYFQAWKDMIKSPQPYTETSDPEDTAPSLGIGRFSYPTRSLARTSFTQGDLTLRLKTKQSEIPYLIKFTPSSNTFNCEQFELGDWLDVIQPQRENAFNIEQVMLEGWLDQFRPSDGIMLDLTEDCIHDNDLHDPIAKLRVLKCPLERGADGFTYGVARTWFSDGRTAQVLPKRVIWARRLGLSSHRFLYLVIRDIRIRSDLPLSRLDLDVCGKQRSSAAHAMAKGKRKSPL